MSGYREYFPVQRIAQACMQCRRKKCRCTGERPTCAHCHRLKIECVYHDESPPKRSSRLGPEEEPQLPSGNTTASAMELILQKLSALEQKIDSFGCQLHKLEENLNQTKLNVHQVGHQKSEREPPLLVDDATPEDAVMAVVDAYFYYCHHQPYSFFHEGHFRTNWKNQKIPAHLLLAVMATATRFCAHPYFSGRAYEASVEYANRAWKLIITDCFTAGKTTEVSTVQTIALLGLFDFTAGKSRHGSAWVKVGMAVRIAQDCGLMLENAAHLPYVEQEERRRVFWSVYLLDRLVSCGRGRPPAIVDASCHLQLPSEDLIWKNGLWVKTQSLDEVTNRTLTLPQRPSPFAQVIAISQILGRSSQFMLQDLNIRSPHPPWDPSSDFAALESDLLHFDTYLETKRPLREILSPHITADGLVDYHNAGPILYSRVLYHLCYCLLNHPFLLRRRINTCRGAAPVSFISRSFDLGWLHAQQMIELERDARDSGCSFHSSASSYCFIVAGSIIALRTYDEDPVVSEKARGLLDEVLAHLDLVGQHWNNVSCMAVVLRRMMHDGLVGSKICGQHAEITSLTPIEEENMWAVVDYSTMSSETTERHAGDGRTPISIWPDSMFELFGAMDYQLISNTMAVDYAIDSSE